MTCRRVVQFVRSKLAALDAAKTIVAPVLASLIGAGVTFAVVWTYHTITSVPDYPIYCIGDSFTEDKDGPVPLGMLRPKRLYTELYIINCTDDYQTDAKLRRFLKGKRDPTIRITGAGSPIVSIRPDPAFNGEKGALLEPPKEVEGHWELTLEDIREQGILKFIVEHEDVNMRVSRGGILKVTIDYPGR